MKNLLRVAAYLRRSKGILPRRGGGIPPFEKESTRSHTIFSEMLFKIPPAKKFLVLKKLMAYALSPHKDPDVPLRELKSVRAHDSGVGLCNYHQEIEPVLKDVHRQLLGVCFQFKFEYFIIDNRVASTFTNEEIKNLPASQRLSLVCDLSPEGEIYFKNLIDQQIDGKVILAKRPLKGKPYTEKQLREKSKKELYAIIRDRQVHVPACGWTTKEGFIQAISEAKKESFPPGSS